MQSGIRAKLDDDGLCQANRGGNTLDESLGTGTIDIRVDRYPQHSLHYRRLYTVSSACILVVSHLEYSAVDALYFNDRSFSEFSLSFPRGNVPQGLVVFK